MTRAEIDAAIARHAETETLYDQPYEDKNRIRVSGPFTVESLSPDRIVSTDEERPASELIGQKQPGRADFATMILDNLRKAGVQNTFKNERLKFDRLEPHAGAWIHATGEYTNGDGKTRRVAVTIGPEYGTVTPQQVKEAAKEAVSGIGFDILIVCGFAFDPHVSEEAKRYGKLTVLPARMNPDLLIGDTLKNTGAGNLFMVFGEPDIAITRDAEQQGRRRSEGRRCLRPDDRPDPEFIDRRHRLLVHRHRLQRRVLLRPARLLPRGRRPLRQAQARPPSRDRRGPMGDPLQHQELPLRAARVGQDRRQGHQPLRGRSAQGLQGLSTGT